MLTALVFLSNSVWGSETSISCLLAYGRLAVRASIRVTGFESRVQINTPSQERMVFGHFGFMEENRSHVLAMMGRVVFCEVITEV